MSKRSSAMGVDRWKARYAALLNRVFGLAILFIFCLYFLPWLLQLSKDREAGEVKTVEARLVRYSELSAPPPIEIHQPPQTEERKSPKVKSVKYVEPVVKADEEVPDTSQMPTMDDLQQALPALTDSEGVDSIVVDQAIEVVPMDPPEEENKVYTFVEQQPEFPGGISALYAYLSEHLSYPQLAKENRVSGTVIVQFIVEEDGRVTELEIARGVSPELNEEALRVLAKMPPWNPGRMNGQDVRVRFTLPVRFTILDE